LAGEKLKKLVQFTTLFHTLKHGRPMLEYEAHKELFDFLNLEENPKMQWTYSLGWAMVQHMHGIVLEATKSIVGATQFISLVMRSVPSTIRASFYFMLMWFRIGCEYQSFFPLNVWWQDEVLINLTQILMQALMHEGGLMKYLIHKKLMTFGAYGVSIFQGIKSNVIRQISNGWAPHSTEGSLHGS
jgi:hypothetical protein